MRTRIFNSIFITALIMIAGSSLVLFLIIQAMTIERDSERLQTFTASIAAALNAHPDPSLQFLYLSNYRITLIDPDGTVVFDNRHDPLTLENHAGREEFEGALRQGMHRSFRYSATLDSLLLYQAERLADGRVLRVAVSLMTVFSQLTLAVAVMLLLCAALAAASWYAARRLTARILDPLNSLDFSAAVVEVPYPEISPLVRRIWEQKDQISRQLDEISKQHDEFMIITNSMKEGLILLNRDFGIIAINKAALKFYGTREQFVGRNLPELDASETMRRFCEHPAAGGLKSAEVSLNNRDLKYYFNRIEVGDELIGYAILIINVTAQKLAEKHRQEFTANVSHELKTPLQSIIGYAELIENGIARDEDLSAFGGRIRRQGAALLQLIEDIIFLSALDEGQAHFESERFTLNDVARDILEVLDPPIRERGLTATISGDVITVHAIYRLFYELLYNLCENAVKYNRPAGRLDIAFEQRERHIALTVSDTGIGIAEEFQGRVFERFFRAEKNLTPAVAGTGLGLSIVKRITLYYRGKIKLRSTRGAGSSFCITFPSKNLLSGHSDPVSA